MTNSNGQAVARRDGPTENQVKALRARARDAHMSEADFAGQVGGTSIEGLSVGQVKQLFDLTNTPEQQQRQTRSVTVPPAPEEVTKLALSLGCSEEEAEVIMSVIAPDLNAAEIRFVISDAKERGMNLKAKDAYAVKIQGRPQLIPGVDWTRAKVSPELDGPVTIEYCFKPERGQPPVWLSLANFSEDDKPHAGRARGYRKDNPNREYIFEGLYSEHHRSENAWIQYDLHMFGLSLERQFYRHTCAETLRGLHMELPPVEQLESAARVYMWASAGGHGYDHDAIHLMFGIMPEDSLQEELDRRGMDWRDAVGFVQKRIAGHGDLPALPDGVRQAMREPDAVQALYGRDDSDKRPTEQAVRVAEKAAELQEAEASVRLDEGGAGTHVIERRPMPQADAIPGTVTRETPGPEQEDDYLGLCSACRKLPATGSGPNSRC